MKLKTHRASFGGTTHRPSRFDAGHRVQSNSQLAGVRHFQLGAAHVKPAAAERNETKQMIASVNRNYLRALRAAELNAWMASGGDVLRASAA